MNNKDTVEAPGRIRLVKREGRFANEWYYPDAAIMPFETEFQYARVDPPAAPGYLHCSCGAACTEEEYAKHRAMGHDAGTADEADKALAQGILHGFTLGYEVTKILERRALAALAQARKETWEKAIKVVTKVHERTLGSVSDWQVLGPLESAMKKDLESASKQER